MAVVPGALAIQVPETEHDFTLLSPHDYAKMANWVYGSGELPGGCTETGRSKHEHVLFVRLRVDPKPIDPKFGSKSRPFHVLVIRGTDNADNALKDAQVVFKGGALPVSLKDAAENAVKMLGSCDVATGHSLGGRLVEEVPHTWGVTFNSFQANRDSTIVAFRMEGDPAQVPKGHTDRSVKAAGGAALGGAVVGGAMGGAVGGAMGGAAGAVVGVGTQLHSMENMARAVSKAPWTTSEQRQVARLAPEREHTWNDNGPPVELPKGPLRSIQAPRFVAGPGPAFPVAGSLNIEMP